jgi:hypothetical protein
MMMGAPPGAEAADDAPYLVVAVLEVQDFTPQGLKLFKSGTTVTLNHRWGRTYFTKQGKLDGLSYDAFALETNSGKPLHTVRRQFQELHDRIMKGTPPVDRVLEVARWALEHGLLDEFVKVMNKLAETEKTNTAVTAYLKVKEDLARPLSREDVAGVWKEHLLKEYKITQTDTHHFALIHNASSDALTEVKAQLDRLEKTFRSFYYWWAMRGINLPMPSERLVAILTEKGEEFKRLNKHLTASPVLADSFCARREGLSVFSSKRTDESYQTLERVAGPSWSQGFSRNEIIRDPKSSRGTPKGMAVTKSFAPRTYAVLLKALEEEWEATGITHEASRQLLYASGLLPRKVHVPEWVQFGMGSLFERPLQSPWGGAGAANPYWLPRFKEFYQDRKYNRLPGGAAPGIAGNLLGGGPSPIEALIKTVGDTGFRTSPEPTPPLPGEAADDTAHRAKELHTRKARAAAWALTYFLAQRELPGLRRYFQELGRMPRDIDLDDKVLLTCFARAFDSLNPDGSVNRTKLGGLASRWITFIKEQRLDAEAVHKQIRDHYTKAAKASTPLPGAGRPGVPGGGGGAQP